MPSTSTEKATLERFVVKSDPDAIRAASEAGWWGRDGFAPKRAQRSYDAKPRVSPDIGTSTE